MPSRAVPEMAPLGETPYRRDESPPPPPPPPPRSQQQGHSSQSNRSGGETWSQAHQPGPPDKYPGELHQYDRPGNPQETFGPSVGRAHSTPSSDMLSHDRSNPMMHPNPAAAPVPTPNASDESGGTALIPNFFNMPSTLFGQRPTSQQVPAGPVQMVPQGFAAPVVAQPSFQHPATRLGSNQLSFTVPAGVGMAHQQIPGGVPPGSVPSFKVGAPQMVPGRGYSFTAPSRR
jgi:hypothetical protein